MDDEKWPKYKDIIPKDDDLKRIVEVVGEGDKLAALILGALCHASCICNLGLYQKPIELLSKAIEGRGSVYVHEKESADRPFMIKAGTNFGNIIYIQMPVTTKNEIKKDD